MDTAIPSRAVPRGRPYSNITYDASTGLIVAAASLKTRFLMFDEDGNTIWTPDSEPARIPGSLYFDQRTSTYLGPNIGDPYMECSSLELIAPDDWATLDG